MDRINTEVISEKDRVIAELQGQLSAIDQKYQQQIESQEGEIRFLKLEVERFRQMANVEYVKSLEDKVEELKEVISNQEEEYRELVRKNEDISKDALSTR